jgi:DNA modification methylase
MSTTMITPAMARQIDIWPTDKLRAYDRNARTHPAEQVAQIAASIREFGFVNPVLVDSSGGIIAGHGRLLAARQLGLAEVPVVVLDHLSDIQRRAYIIADNKLAMNAGWNLELLAQEVRELELEAFDLDLIGFSESEVAELLAIGDALEGVDEVEEAIPEAPAQPVTRLGDIWRIAGHRLICGDCRDSSVIARLFEGVKANLVITSPPYATQREYDPLSGFTPVPPEKYADWFRVVAANIAAVLAPDGSYFLNIKPHADDGERSLYVMDLVLEHKRQWGWRFVDELCWRKTDNGVPGGWGNRFKNAFEPVYHFCREPQIKFRPAAVGHVSEDCFSYSPNNPKSTSGSGLLGTGARGPAAGKSGAADDDGRFAGIARPSNVIEVKSESSQGSHSAPFPRALVEFFVKAFSDPGDIAFDPFLGSASTIAAAAVLDRVGYGVEISPAYCDVALRRLGNLIGEEPVLAETGQTMAEVAAERGVPMEQVQNPRLRDSHRIQHHGPAPFYGTQRKVG